MLHHRTVKYWVRWEFVSSRTEFKTSSPALQSTKTLCLITRKTYYPTVLRWHPQVRQHSAPMSLHDGAVHQQGFCCCSPPCWCNKLHTHPGASQTIGALKKKVDLVSSFLPLSSHLYIHEVISSLPVLGFTFSFCFLCR